MQFSLKLLNTNKDILFVVECSFFRYDEDLAQQDQLALDPRNKLGPGIGLRGPRDMKGRPSPATWK